MPVVAGLAFWGDASSDLMLAGETVLGRTAPVCRSSGPKPMFDCSRHQARDFALIYVEPSALYLSVIGRGLVRGGRGRGRARVSQNKGNSQV